MRKDNELLQELKEPGEINWIWGAILACVLAFLSIDGVV
jgi:hypothetical protein